MEFERPLIEVPLEGLRGVLKRTRQTVEKELSALVASLKAQALPGGADEYASRLAGLRSILANLKLEYTHLADLLEKRARYWHQQSHNMGLDPDSPEYISAVGTHIRLVAVRWYLIRGYFEAAQELCTPEIEPLVDWEAMRERSRVLKALQSRDLGPCIAWCEAHAAFLKRKAIPLEYKAKLLKLKEMAAAGDELGAVLYARSHIATMKDIHFHASELLKVGAAVVAGQSSLYTTTSPTGITSAPSLSAAMTALAAKSAPPPDTDAALGDWAHLQALFARTFDELHGCACGESLQLPDWVYTGISSTLTDACFGHTALHCPACSPIFEPLQSGLALAHHSKSLLDPDCVVLPNNHIIGLGRLETRGDKVVDPVTGEEFSTWNKVFPL